MVITADNFDVDFGGNGDENFANEADESVNETDQATNNDQDDGENVENGDGNDDFDYDHCLFANAADEPSDASNTNSTAFDTDVYCGPCVAYTVGASSDWLSENFTNERNHELQLPKDHCQPSDKQNPNTGHDKRTLAIDLDDWQARHIVSNGAMNDLLEVLQKHFKYGNFPTIPRNPLLQPRDAPTVVRNNIHKYVGKDTRTIVIDVCRSDCVAFHGMQSVRGAIVDCSVLLYCPFCHAQRYSICSHPNCKGMTYDSCNPHKRDKSGKLTDHQGRNAMKTAFFRPMSAKFLSLYQQSQTPGNENLLKYMDKPSKFRVTRDKCFIDTADGREVDRIYEEMVRQGHMAKQQYEHEHPGTTLHICSLVYTLFYDGMVMFDRDCNSVWPMVCSVLNTNPTLRTRLGVGLFMPLLHDMVTETGAETHIMRHFLAAEMKQLEDGIIFTFDLPTDSGTTTHTVYLQARCVLFHLDGDALQHICRLHGSNSKLMCKCRTCVAFKRKPINSMVANGTRGMLHPNHYLRQFVVKNSHFPTLDEEIDYYSGSVLSAPIVEELFSKTKLQDRPKEGGELYSLGHSKILDTDIQRLAIKFKKGHNATDNWYNHEFPLILFQPHLCYPARDRRVQLFFADCHLKHEVYLECGRVVMEDLARYDQKYWFHEKPKSKYRPSCNGVTGLCPILEETISMKVTSLTYDMMHIAKNVNQYYNEIICGDRAYSPDVRRLCASQKLFGFMQYNDAKYMPPWRVSIESQIIIDSLCNCFLIPSGYKTKFGLRWPCRRNKQLRAREHLIFLTAYNFYLYSFTNMRQGYVDFFARFASDVSRLLNPCISESELEQLVLSIYETRGLFEGLFPESEFVLAHHEIVDVVNHIFNFGTVRGMCCFTGERSLSTLSSLIAKGGVHPMKGINKRYVALENTHSKNLRIPFEFLTNEGLYSDFVLKLVGKTQKIELTDHELQALCNSVQNVVETYEIDRATEKSSFFRLVHVYGHCFTYYHMSPAITFAKWVRRIYSLYIRHYNANFPQALEVHLRSLVKGIELSVTLSSADVAALEGVLVLSDFEGIIKDIATFAPVAYTQVFIKGLKFKCRGTVYREVQAAARNDVPTNDLNDVRKNWYRDEDYSSWARVHRHEAVIKKDKKTQVTSTSVATTTEFVQLNFACRLNWKNDSLLHGLAFADACIHISTNDAKKRKHFIAPGTSFNGSRQYLCLNNVCSTAVGLSVLDLNMKPMIHQTRFNSLSWNNERDKLRLAPINAVAARIYLLELHPERVEYIYGSFEADLDKTKVWESPSHLN